MLPLVKSAPLALLLSLLAALACGGNKGSTSPAPEAKNEPVVPLTTVAMSGQSIAVVPLTLLIPDEVSALDPKLANRAASLAWADSTILEALNARGPEVKWIGPIELRKVARRAPTVAPDPDRMGQAMLRAKFEDVPEPLRTQLRQLLALAGGRFALVPAALVFSREPDGRTKAELALALADTRTGKVIWRSLAWGTGDSPEHAFTAALAAVLPVGLGLR
jgi:hypothetical protein